MKKHIILLLIAFLFISRVYSQVFTEIHSGFHGVIEPVAAWIQDANGSPDAFLAGDYYTDTKEYLISQYSVKTKKDYFSAVSSPFPALSRGMAATADYDKDGDDDILISGYNASGQLIMRLYRNDKNRRFYRLKESFTPVSNGSFDWGDFDHDGDPDILVTGKRYSNQLATVIYRNDKGLFTEQNTNIPGVYNGSARWADFDNDNDLDVLITGDIGGKPFTAVYKNNNGKFVRLAQTFYPLRNSDCAWADFDLDGDMDFIISGEDVEGFPVCMVYTNEERVFFREVPVAIKGLKNCTIDLADYDNDGDMDILMTGESLERPYTLVYENKSSFNFENIVAGLPGVSSGIALWGDYDNDGDQDILLAGITICYDFIGKIYRNNLNPAKRTPASDENSIFINTVVAPSYTGPYYYYVFSSCFCDPTGGDNPQYHLYISNIHREKTDYDLNYKFNDILIKTVPNWGKSDRGHRTSNGFITKQEAVTSRRQVIESYKQSGFQVHYINW